ncbi:MAG TPA: PadR family transcriptional regulator [Candidatus Saccharimonadales bacterium]|nr:PadR family transcriptional regulator [Candidatus Saccharimonadales bacterium]
MILDKYEQTLLNGWEDTHKQSQLTLWIMLALKHGPKHMNAIKKFISNWTNQTILADDKSIYRALRRFNEAELISFTNKPSQKGPDLKIYELTDTGSHVLSKFIERNISDIFFHQQVKELLLAK